MIDLNTRFSKARIQLAWDVEEKGHSFYGCILVKMQIINKTDIDTMATDGKDIFYNKEFTEELSDSDLKGVLVHEAMHRGFKHHLRQGDRDPQIWNMACDFAINPIIKKSGLTLPQGALIDPKFNGWMAEKIYNEIFSANKSNKQKPQDGQGQGESTGETQYKPQSWGNIEDNKATEMSPEQLKSEEADINEEIFQAVRQAKERGTIPAEVANMIKVMERSDVDWSDVVVRHAIGDNPDDFTFRRPHRKMFVTHDIYAPTIQCNGVGHIVVGIDSSGSVTQKELNYFLGGLNEISLELKPMSVTIITCDATIQNVIRYEQGEEIEKMSANGRGGTCVAPVFDYIKDNDVEVDSLIYFTDMGIHDFPKEEQQYPVLWVSTDMNSNDAPIGQTTFMKMK
mgnify:FL=1|tara:strand:- start:1381 stop:2571 length:1191 start_codon:yes stop_codon:yes gene_type:complete